VVLNDQATLRMAASARSSPDVAVPADEAVGDASLWAELAAAGELPAFARAWLAILGRSAPAMLQAALLYGAANQGKFEPIARWAKTAVDSDPAGFARGGASILAAIIESKQPAIESPDGNSEPKFAGIPVLVGDDLYGAVLVEAALTDAAAARRLVRHLQWGSASLEAFLRRTASQQNSALVRRTTILIDTLSAVTSQDTHAEACNVLMARAAEIFQCQRCALGYREGQETRLTALFQTANFERKHELGRMIEAAMDEAIDQGMTLVTPAPPGSPLVAVAQARLARENEGAALLTAPLMRHEHAVGAITLERFDGRAFIQTEVELCDALVAAVTPALVDKRQRDWSLHRIAGERLLKFARKVIGPQHLGYKALVALVLFAVAFCIFATGPYRIHAHAQIEGEVRRILNAPFDGYVRAQFARAGEIVREGELLAELQDNDLALDRLRHVAQRRQYQLELERALGRRDLAAANIARSQMEQQDAEIELADQMLARTRIVAPFDSVIVSGDLSQSVGRPVARGDVLFELAPLDRYRITLLVPEMDTQSVRPGLTGQVLLAALPDRTFEFEVRTVTPVARAAEGVNGFEALADLKGNDPRLRPGMEGVAKIDIGERHLIWIWTHELVYWLRVKLWALVP
jgi:hypothetical protein